MPGRGWGSIVMALLVAGSGCSDGGDPLVAEVAAALEELASRGRYLQIDTSTQQDHPKFPVDRRSIMTIDQEGHRLVVQTTLGSGTCKVETTTVFDEAGAFGLVPPERRELIGGHAWVQYEASSEERKQAEPEVLLTEMSARPGFEIARSEEALDGTSALKYQASVPAGEVDDQEHGRIELDAWVVDGALVLVEVRFLALADDPPMLSRQRYAAHDSFDLPADLADAVVVEESRIEELMFGGFDCDPFAEPETAGPATTLPDAGLML